jgi:outer membrane protein OmpA-like peptidoglycan-associated protein
MKISPRMRFSFFIVLVSLTVRVLAQQNHTAIAFDNYVGAFYGTYNPSSIVDSRSKFAVFTNFNNLYTSNFYARDYVIYNADNYKGRLVDNKDSGYENRSWDTEILGIKADIDHKSSFSYAFKLRIFNNQRGIPEIWNENAALEFQNNQTNIKQDILGFSLANARFTEHAFTYARVIFDQGPALLKAGASLKILNGLQSRYFYANSGTITFDTPTGGFANFDDVDFTYGKDFGSAQTKYKNRGLGFDLGVTYELRPDYKEQYYDMDGEKNLIKYDINKYKWKFSASITDIGFIGYRKDTATYNFNAANYYVDAAQLYDVGFDFMGPAGFIDGVLMPSGTKSAEQEEKFRMTLPTMIHLGADYHYKKDWYASYDMSLPLGGVKDPTRLKYNFIQTVTPRLEKEMYSVMLPLSMVGNGKFYVGLAGRFTFREYSAYLGSNNVMFLFGQKASLTRSLFFGAAYSILYKTPKDRDKDKVSDQADQCPDDPGYWSLRGCPDTDGDGIPDKEDYCIYDQGPLNTRGCPDTDGDGIIDMNDRCPEVKGLGVHLGCPDRDFDGVIDVADKCPDDAGIELNNGCPFEFPDYCSDMDGDGLPDKADKCPEEAGSVYNFGCPVDKNNINNINGKKEELDPNHTEAQMKVLSNNDTIRNYFTSREQLNKVLKDKTVMKDVSLYFDVDQANLIPMQQEKFNNFMKDIKTEEGKISFVVIGYTDRDGSLDYNLILSKKRAETVMRKIVDSGYDEELIKVYYYGESKSLYKGSYTDEQKRLDRKVEIRVIREK